MYITIAFCFGIFVLILLTLNRTVVTASLGISDPFANGSLLMQHYYMNPGFPLIAFLTLV